MSVVAAFAAGGAFGGGSALSRLADASASQASAAAGAISIDASTMLNVMDMTKVQAMVSQSCASVERRIYEHLKAVGVMR